MNDHATEAGVPTPDEDPNATMMTSDVAPTHDRGGGDGDAAVAEAEETVVFTGEGFMPITAAIESMLFVSDKPVEPAQIARALHLPVEEVQAGLARLAADLVASQRGLRLQVVQGDRVRLVSRPDAARAIEEFLNLDLSTRLSGPALETLAVVAYRQPVTRAQVEAVRGVDCGAVLRTLVQRGLIEEVGRLEGVGRPILYGITEQFMHHFGLTALSDLPPLPEADQDMLAAISDTVLDGASPAQNVADAARSAA